MIPTFVRDEDGNWYINDALKYVKGGILIPRDAPIVSAAAVLAAGTLRPGLSAPQVLEGPEDSLVEIFSFMGEHGAADAADVQARLRVRIEDVAWRRGLMNREVLANHVFSGRLQPFRLLRPLKLEQQQTLILRFENWSTIGQSNFRIAAEMGKFQTGNIVNARVTRHIEETRAKALFFQPYWLTSDTNPVIPAGGTVDIFFTGSRDVALTMSELMASTITTGVAGDTQEVVAFQIFDPLTERPLQSQPVTLNCGAGTSAFPFVLSQPLQFPPNTRARMRVTNLITDQPTEVFFTFHGVASYAAAEQMSARDPAMAAPGAMRYGAS